MARLLKLLSLGYLLGLTAAEKKLNLTPRQWLDFDPSTNPKAQVISNNGMARFSVLTQNLIRMEFSNSKTFVDVATFNFIHRNVPLVDFSYSNENDQTIIKTNALSLYYNGTDLNSFNNNNLKVTYMGDPSNNVPAYTWTPGLNNEGNLFGTFRTLDGNSGPVNLDCQKSFLDDSQHCRYGIISTNGIAVIDDTHKPFFDNQDWPWPVGKSYSTPSGDICTQDSTRRVDCGYSGISSSACIARGCCYSPTLNVSNGFDDNVKSQGVPWCFYSLNSDQDLYLFGYGLNFKAALKDYTQIAGKIPVPPRYAFGVWYSRYWAYSDIGYQTIVNEYEQHDVPLDVLVTDMDWHLTFYAEDAQGANDQAGQRKGWTGFTWDSHLFPSSTSFLKWCKRRGLKNTINIHPASGIQPWESTYEQMALAMGQDPSSQIYVPFNVTENKFVTNWFDIVLKPLSNDGIDFYWLDWQQGEDWIKEEQYHDINPTFLLNHYFFTAPSQFSDSNRPLLFHRWGGLGNHRYQIGFSGDVNPSWSSLSFQPYFTATAANVGYVYWSHDLGGHTLPTEAQLYTRWLQWGAFSPIFRTHCTKNANNDRRIWTYPWAYYTTLRKLMKLRQSLVPYLYTKAHETHNTGVGTVHPVYYDFPYDNRSYTYTNQYMFGDLLIQPIVKAVDTTTGMTQTTVFFPQGTWIGFFSGKVVSGPAEISDSFTIDEIPAYVPAGLILPLLPVTTAPLGSSGKIPLHLDLHAFPVPYLLNSPQTIQEGSGTVTEDDGTTMSYMLPDKLSVSTQTFSYSLNGASSSLNFTINGYSGNAFQGRPDQRSYSLYIHNILPAKSVSLLIPNSNPISFEYEAWDEYSLTKGEVGSNTYSYDGFTLTLVVHLRVPLKTDQQVIVSCQLLSDNQNAKSINNLSVDGRGSGSSVEGLGFAGLLKRFSSAKDLLDAQWGTSHEVYQDNYPNLLFASEAGSMISSNPLEIVSILNNVYNQWQPTALTEIKGLTALDTSVQSLLLAQLADS